MEQTKPSAAALLFKKGLSWFVVVLGLLLGIAGMALVESALVFSPYFRPGWSHLAGFSLLAVVALLASLIAVENPRRAGLLFLIAAPIMAACVAWSQRMSIVVMGVSVRRLLAVFAGTSLLFLIPGAFWLSTASSLAGGVLRVETELENLRARSAGNSPFPHMCSCGFVCDPRDA